MEKAYKGRSISEEKRRRGDMIRGTATEERFVDEIM
jgi:hypothetical protein